ncbi:MAG TPA: sialidase family protein [Candidatus Thermoplasmatota archaeon]|nr:sialidase family protein [Candidatus Thermoplasmatota archaeon]
MQSKGAVLGLAFLLLAAGTAGCFGPGVAREATPPTVADAPSETAATRRTVVHGTDGRVLPDSAYPGELPVLGQRMIPGAQAREPMVAATHRGIYYDALVNMKTQVWGSRDQGLSWDPILRNPVANVVDGSGGYADPFLYADPATDRLYSAELFSTSCIILEWSDGPDPAWDWSIIGDCTANSHLHDHQSIVAAHPQDPMTKTTGYPNVLHYCASSYTATGAPMARCSASFDGGRTFSSLTDTGLDHCTGLTGHLAASPSGTVFLPQVACSGPGKNVTAWVALSRDDGRTWTPSLVDQRPARGLAGPGPPHDGAVAADAAGNVYYYYLDATQMPRLSISRDDGRTWAPSLDVSVPGVTGCAFPSIVAGDTGRIAMSCIGTTMAGGFRMADADGPRATWNSYVTVSQDALAAQPVFATTTANLPSDPLARGKPAAEGAVLLASPVDSMGDFLKVTADPEGRILLSLVDGCTLACSDGGTQDSPRPGYAWAAVGVQTGGTGLRAAADP